MGLMNFVKKHTVGAFSILVGIAALGVAGGNLIRFNSEYNSYLEEYDRMQEEVNSKFAKAPESTFVDGNYVTYSGDAVSTTKSQFTKSYVFGARDAVINPLNVNKGAEYVKLDEDNTKLSECISGLDRMGGAINFNFTTDHYGYGDIEISMRTSLLDKQNHLVGLTNITDYIKIQMNRMEVKTVEAELDDSEEFTSLVLKNCFLLEGANVVTFTTSAYNPINANSTGSSDQGNNNTGILYVMPEIRNLTVFTDVNIVTQND